MKIYTCGCGHEEATLPFDEPGHPQHGKIILHELCKGKCVRKLVPENLMPTDFRVGTGDFEGMDVCTVGGCTITYFTLTQQRGYFYSEAEDRWSMPKSEESIDSLSSIASY